MKNKIVLSKIGAITLLAVLAMLLSISFVSAAGVQEIRITTDTNAQQIPAIYEDKIVWQDNRNGNWDIYMYNLSVDTDGNGIPNYLEDPKPAPDPAEIAICNESHDQQKPIIFGDIVVWQDNRNGNWDIYYKDLTTGTEYALCTASGDQTVPDIFGNWVVWQDMRVGTFGRIYLYDLSGGPPSSPGSAGVLVGGGPGTGTWNRQPAVWGNSTTWRVVWSQLIYGTVDWNIVGNFSGSSIPVTTDPKLQILPDIYENNVVWVDNRNGANDIYMRNLNSGGDVPVTKAPGSQRYPHIYGNRVVWQDEATGDIKGYNLLAKKEFNISSTSMGSQQRPNLFKNKIVWQDNRNGSWDIYLFERTPVIIIPGIPGTSLHCGDDVVWLPNLCASASDVEKLAFYANGTPQYPLTYGHLIGLGSAESCLLGDPEEKAKKKGVGYWQLVEFFKDQGYILDDGDGDHTEGEDLFLFPYDWRRDNRDTATILAPKIENIKNWTGYNKVNIVAHSNGGLVAKYYMTDPDNAANVDKFIMIGSPQLGAPKAFDVLRNGDCYFRIPLLGITYPNKQAMKDSARNMPLSYQLLPSKKYFQYQAAYISYHFNDIVVNGNVISGPLSYEKTMDFLRNAGDIPYDSMPYFNKDLIDSFENFHNEIDDWSGEAMGVDTYVIVGSGLPTKGYIVEVPDSPIKTVYVYINGDTTVPFISANESAGAKKHYYVKDEHAKLPSNTTVQDIIIELLKGNEPATSTSPIPLGGTSWQVLCPTELHFYDSFGNHLGPTSDGYIEYNISFSQYDVMNEGKSAFLPAGQNYTMVIKSNGTGVLNLKLKEIKDDTVTKSVIYKSIPLITTTVLKMSYYDGITNYNLSVDDEGDGNFESQIQPSEIIEGEEDDIPPASITNLQNVTGQTWINWTWTNPPDADFNYTVVYLDGVWKTNTSKPFYTATGLAPETYYEIGTHTVDTVGNINTTWVNQTTKTQAVPDTTPPASITNLQNVTGQTWINWTWTNPPDADFNYTTVFLNGTWQTNTSNPFYNATGLTPDAYYEIDTRTVDTVGNINTTWVNQTTKTQTVPDIAPPASITNLQNVTGQTWINWTWTNPPDADFNYTVVFLNGTWHMNTSDPFYNATGLAQDTYYEIGTHTVDEVGNINTTWVNQTTKTRAVPDTTPPAITNVIATGITINSATISWDTDEPSDSLVKYGTESGSYVSTAYDATDVTTHSITLTGLSANTTYYYVVNSTDQSGNSNESIEHSFTTLAAPAVIPANVVIKPETLNLKSKGKFTAFITLPEGYNVADIDISTVVCEGASAVKGMVTEDNKYIAKFDIQGLVGVPTGNAVTLTVTGELYDGTSFEGSDTIRVIDKGKGGKK